MHQLPTGMPGTDPTPSHLPQNGENDGTANVCPESEPGKKSVDKVGSECKMPHPQSREYLGPLGRFRIPKKLKDLSRRPSLESSEKPPPLFYHPLFSSSKEKVAQASNRQQASVDSSDFSMEMALDLHSTPSDQPYTAPSHPKRDTSFGSLRKTSVPSSLSEGASLETSNSQQSLVTPNASFRAPSGMPEGTPSPKVHWMSPLAPTHGRRSSSENTRAGKIALTPLGQISIRKLSHKFSSVKLRGMFSDRAADKEADKATEDRVAAATPARMTSGPVSGSVSPSTPLATHIGAFMTGPYYTCPTWERGTDVYWEKDPDVKWSDSKQLITFKSSLVKYLKDSGHTMTSNMIDAPYFRLPDIVRHRICKYLVCDEDDKPIRMNPVSAYKPVWPEEHFESLQSVLQSLERYTSVSSGFRADILATLFTIRRFHVVWSPYVMPLTSPAAVYYMRKYSGLMQHITLEFDFTKHGFSAERAASALKPGIQNIFPRVDEFIDTQLERDKDTMLFSLRVLVRRYHGSRKDENDGDRGEGKNIKCPPRSCHRLHLQNTVPYVDDDHLRILNPLKCLRGMVERARIVGCTDDYTAELIRYLWLNMPEDESERAKHCRHISPSTAYPLLPGQSSYLDYGPDRGHHVLKHPATFVGSYSDDGPEASTS